MMTGDGNTFVKMMATKTPFCFARFNDGEMNAIDRTDISVARGDQYVDQSLSDALREALTYEAFQYWVGMPCPECMPKLSQLANNYVRDNYPYRTLAVLLSNDNWPSLIQTLVLKTGQRPVWVISGDDQDWNIPAKECNLDIRHHIKLPRQNAWQHRGEVMNEWKHLPEQAVVFMSCGPLSRVLARHWWQERNDCTIIDTGSALDPFTRNVWQRCHKGENGKNQAPYCSICNTKGDKNER